MGICPLFQKGELMKRCSSCKIEKDESEFYRNKRSKDGLKSQCKKCHLEGSIRTRDKERHRISNRQWMRNSNYYDRPEVRNRERKRALLRNNTLKAKIRYLTIRAIELGLLVRPDDCGRCGKSGDIQAHHPDYSNPLNVIWLCPLCHAEEHRIKESTHA